jgi:hypothetical protein
MLRLLDGRTTRSVVVLHGLGGIGKTQLSITFMHRHKFKYTAIFWVNANDESSLKRSFVNIAQLILRDHSTAKVPTSVDLEEDVDGAIKGVKAWLSMSKNQKWLMIFDNYDNPKVPGDQDPTAVDLRGYLPACDHGSIIVTTRSSQVNLGTKIHIQKLLDIQDGLRILANTSGRTGVMDGMFVSGYRCQLRGY